MSVSALTVLKLDIPCQVPWEQMTPVDGEPGVRHCSRCDLDVRDLSAMTGEEAQAYLNRRNGRTCVSFQQDAGGGVVTLDYDSTPRGRRWAKPAVSAAIALTTLAVGASALLPTVNRARGGVMAMPAGAYSPFAPSANPNCAAQSQLVPVQLKSDPTLQPLLAALPTGVEVVDLQYRVHPEGMSQDFGRCIVLGRHVSKPADPTIEAVIWIMSPGYAQLNDLSGADPTHPLRVLKSSERGDVLIWTKNGELEKLLPTVEFDGQ